MLAARTVEAMARVIPVKEGVSFTVVKTSMMSDPTHFMSVARTVEAMARVIPVKEGVSFTVVKTSMMSDPTHFMSVARTVEAMARVISSKGRGEFYCLFSSVTVYLLNYESLRFHFCGTSKAKCKYMDNFVSRPSDFLSIPHLSVFLPVRMPVCLLHFVFAGTTCIPPIPSLHETLMNPLQSLGQAN